MIAIVAGAIPALWGGLLLILLFSHGSGLLGLFPSQGFPNDGWKDCGRAMASLVLPALATGIATLMNQAIALVEGTNDSRTQEVRNSASES